MVRAVEGYFEGAVPQLIARAEALEMKIRSDLPVDYFRTFEQRLDGVSLEDTHRVGAKFLSVERLRVLVVGDRKRVEEPLRDLGYELTVLNAEGALV